MADTARINAAHQALVDFLDEQLAEVLVAIREKPGPDSDYNIELPEDYTVDLGITDLMALTAKTSNIFGRCARLAGIAKARVDVADEAHNTKRRESLAGSNDKERERNAAIAARDEAKALATYQGIFRQAEALENRARVASESARKLTDKVQAMQIAMHREERGSTRDQDYRPW